MEKPRSRRGGKRKGAGRPRSQNLELVSPGKAASVRTVDRRVAVPVWSGEIPVVPESLTDEGRKVWGVLFGYALVEGTLIPGTVADFASTCELYVEAQRARAALQAQATGTPEWQALSRIYLAFGRDLKEKLRAFRLAPNGLPMASAEKKDEKPKSALEKLKERRAAMSLVGGGK